MENANALIELKNTVQEIIDLIAKKEYAEATLKLEDAGEDLDSIMDHADDDADLVEISHYQVLLNQLYQKIHTPEA